MRSMKRERDVKAEVKKLFDMHGWFWWCPPANAYGRSGISDFHAVRAGVFMVVETKFDDRPTALQQGFLSSIAAEAAFAFVINEKNLQAFTNWMGLFDQAIDFAKNNMTPPVEIGGPLLDAQKLIMEGY